MDLAGNVDLVFSVHLLSLCLFTCNAAIKNIHVALFSHYWFGKKERLRSPSLAARMKVTCPERQGHTTQTKRKNKHTPARRPPPWGPSPILFSPFLDGFQHRSHFNPQKH
eukprot:1138064-Pelagomonas_calceolata.AAC.1